MSTLRVERARTVPNNKVATIHLVIVVGIFQVSSIEQVFIFLTEECALLSARVNERMGDHVINVDLH
jgi:hypothetical protein